MDLGGYAPVLGSCGRLGWTRVDGTGGAVCGVIVEHVADGHGGSGRAFGFMVCVGVARSRLAVVVDRRLSGVKVRAAHGRLG